MGGDRIMSSDHQYGNGTDNETRTEQTNPPPLRSLPDGEEPAGALQIFVTAEKIEVTT
jgi:hypothetical protein